MFYNKTNHFFFFHLYYNFHSQDEEANDNNNCHSTLISTTPAICQPFYCFLFIFQSWWILNYIFIGLNKFIKQRLIKRIDSFNLYEIKSKENNEIDEAKISAFDITKNMIHLTREINILTRLNHPSF